MKHIAKLQKLIKEFKASEKYSPEEKDAIHQLEEKFQAEEDRDLTPLEQFNFYKFIILNEEDPNVPAFFRHARKFFRELFEGNEFLKSFNSLLPFKLDLALRLQLEKLGLFDMEICQLLTKNSSNLNRENYRFILKAMEQNGFTMTREIFIAIVQSFNARRILDIVLDAIDTIRIEKDRLSWDIDVEMKKDQVGQCLEDAKKSLELVLKVLTADLAEKDFEDIYSELFVKLHNGENKWQSSLNLLQTVNELIYEKYFYQVSENQNSLVKTVADALPACSLDIVNVISQYCFFRPPQPSFIPRHNLISQHFAREDEDKGYHQDVVLHQSKIEKIGSFASRIVGEILHSLGVQNKFYPIVVDKIADDFDSIEKLAASWPRSDDGYRYVGLIIQVEKPGEYATAVLFDQSLQTVECIDAYDNTLDFDDLDDLENVETLKKLMDSIKKFDPNTEDLDDEDVEDLQRMQDIGCFTKRLGKYKFIQEREAYVQDTDKSNCVLQSMANLIGMILCKEGKKPHPDSDKDTKNFIMSLYVNMAKGVGLNPLTLTILYHLAGVVYLAGQQIPKKQIEADEEKSTTMSLTIT